MAVSTAKIFAISWDYGESAWKKEEIEKKFKEKNYTAEDVKELVKSTYHTQWKDKHPEAMVEHFQHLTVVNLTDLNQTKEGGGVS